MKKTLAFIFYFLCIPLQTQQTYSNSSVTTGPVAANGAAAPAGYAWAGLQSSADENCAQIIDDKKMRS